MKIPHSFNGNFKIINLQTRPTFWGFTKISDVLSGLDQKQIVIESFLRLIQILYSLSYLYYVLLNWSWIETPIHPLLSLPVNLPKSHLSTDGAGHLAGRQQAAKYIGQGMFTHFCSFQQLPPLTLNYAAKLMALWIGQRRQFEVMRNLVLES